MAVTIKDVARAADTSTATVSKVINGSYAISQETIDRVNRVIKELDYHPNTRARNLAHQSNRTIVFVTSLEKNISFQNPHMFEILCGLEHTLSQKGYSLLVKSIETAAAPQYIKEMADTKQADGFVIHAAVISEELDKLIYQQEIPHLVLGMPGREKHFSWIDVNNRYAGEVAAKYLLSCGYHSVSFLGGTQEDRISMHRLEGVLSVLKEHEVILPENYVQYGESLCDSGYAMTEQVLGGKAVPEAVICANNYLAYGCVQALRDRKFRIPEDIGVLTFDDYPFSQLLKPMLTVVDIDVYGIGAEAGKMMIQKIKKPNMLIQSYITYPAIIERSSTLKRV